MAFEPLPWKKRARCRGLDPSLFVYGRGQDQSAPLAVCNGGTLTDRQTGFTNTYRGACPVRKECREYAERTNSQGVFGGELFQPDVPDEEEVQEVPVVVRVQDGRARGVA